MIGCEKLCGLCVQCRSLVVQLGGDDGCPCAECGNARVVIRDPASLADLLARALQGRGVTVYPSDDDPGDAIRYPCAHVDPDGDVVAWQAWTSFAVYAQRSGNLDAFEARAALSRLLAAGLCSADEALRLLEGT